MSDARDNPDGSRTHGALTRYRVMAIITGVLLLIVTVDVFLKYVIGVDNPTFLELTSVIAIVHGWVYVIYAATCWLLWSRMKWPLGRLVSMVAGGVVPVMSFVVERKVTREVQAQLGAQVDA